MVPFKFDNVQIFTVTIDDKIWTRAKEVIHDALKYQKKTAHIIRAHCSPENYAHKYQLTGVPATGTPVNWPIDSQKYDFYVNEEGLNELIFKSQQPKAKAFRKYCCNELFPKIRNQLLYQRIEEKDMQLALLNDDLTDAQRNVVILEQDNLELQAEVERLTPRAVPHLQDKKKDNGMVVIQKNNGDSYPYIAICGQQGYVAQKIQNKLADYPNGQIVVLAETPNAIIHYNWLRERGCIIANPNRVRHFMLGENYSHQRLIELQDA